MLLRRLFVLFTLLVPLTILQAADSVPLNENDAEFAKKATIGGLMDVQSTEIALKRTTQPQLEVTAIHSESLAKLHLDPAIISHFNVSIADGSKTHQHNNVDRPYWTVPAGHSCHHCGAPLSAARCEGLELHSSSCTSTRFASAAMNTCGRRCSQIKQRCLGWYTRRTCL